MPTRVTTRVTPDWVKTIAPQLVAGFEPWFKEQRELRDAMSTQPIGYSGTGEITQMSRTRLEMAQARWTEWTSPKLSNMLMNYVGRMIAGNLKVEAFAVSGDRAEQARKENLLHACEGILYALNFQVADQDTKASSWEWQVASQSGYPGKIIGLPFVRRNKKGQAVITCEMWDPLTVAHTFEGKPKVIVHFWSTSVGAARIWLSEQSVDGEDPFVLPVLKDAKKDEDTVTLHDVWVEEPTDDDPDEYEVRRSVLVGGECAGVQKTRFTHMPVRMRSTHATTNSYAAVSGAPGQAGMRGAQYEAIRDHARTFFQSLKQMHQNYRTSMSAIFDGLTRALNTAHQIKSDKGDVEAPVGALAAGGEWSTTTDVEIKAVDQAVSQIQVAANLVVEQFEKAFAEVYNLVLYGQSNPGDSGYLQHSKVSHAQVVLNEPASGAASFVLGVFIEILHQLKSDPELVLVANTGRRKGRYDPRQFSPVRKLTSSDFPEDVMLNVEWSPNLGDEIQKIESAKNLDAQGFPKVHIWASVYDVTNPQELMDMRKQQDIRSGPLYMAADTAETALQDWHGAQSAVRRAKTPATKEAAQMVADHRRDIYRVADAQFQAMAAASLGKGTPPAQPGWSPGVLPPEMMPGMNPDQNAQVQGKQSSAAGGQGAVGVTGQGGGQALPMGA